ncbi:O-Antigen ligase [Candidatus Izimaplasma bacterium HR1]|jgi:O-antigen ligase|uniref:O-antigen ligase family protein n=1 Tax=Candidatus Izimoplasma sp. HR1 TaxID=1541959 RepID=UPI0004F6F363|nr:O-Antigen ligase [Candidatus Izimaplasma bacterium HR1]
MKEGLRKISYDLYLIVLGTLAFFSFTGKIDDYILLIYVGIAFLVIIAKKSVFYILPISFFMTMSTNMLRDDITAITIFIIIILVIMAIDTIRNRNFTKIGYLFLPFLALIILSVFSSMNAVDGFTPLVGFVLAIAMALFYVYFINTIQRSNENYAKVAKMFMYLAVVVTMQMLHQVNLQEDAIQFIQRRRINLEWENLNIIIYVNLIAIPFVAYLITKVKVKLPYMILGLIITIGIFLTLSRSSILTVGVYILILVPLVLKLEKDKMLLIIQGLVLFLIIVIGIFFLERYNYVISDVIRAITSREWTKTEDRTVLLEVAIEQFKLHPIFGSGGLYSSAAHLEAYSARNYHNIIARTSSLGVLGFITVALLFIRKTKLIMLSNSSFKWFALVMIYVTAFVNGMFQPMYFYTTYMIYMILVLAVIEVNIKGSIKRI